MLYIIQNGYITPFIQRYLNEKYEIVRSFEKNVLDVDLDRYSTVIILGGHQSVTKINDFPYLLNVVELIKICLEKDKPLFGICLGAQLIAYTLGCEIRSSEKSYIGFDVEILGYKNNFRSHTDYIVPNDKIIVLDEFDNMPYLFKHGTHVYGVQSHPNFPADCVIKYSGHAESNSYAEANREEIDRCNLAIIRYILTQLKKN